MIKQLIFFLFLLSFTPIKAQQNLGSFVDETNLWYNYNDNFPYHQQLHIYYFFQGDTTIGSYTYKKMYEKGIDSTFNPNNGSLDHTINYPLHYEGAFRQEGQKVFAICNDCNINNEFLYIDFNMNVGDTVHYQPFGNSIRTVTAIDSVPFGNQYRKRYTTTGGRFYEGIGHEFGVFRDNSVGIEGNDYLSCFHQFGQTQNVYFWSENNTCHSYSSPTYNSQGALFSTFQPSQCSGSTFTVQAATSDYQTYQWNITGPGGYVNNPTGQNISLLLTQPGAYNVSLTATYDGITDTHIENSFLEVLDLPITSGPSAICIGSIEQLSSSNGGFWSSSNNSIATVTNQGNIHGIGIGSVNLTFTDAQSGCSSSLPVSINGFSVWMPSNTMCIDGTMPIYPSSSNFSWVSNNPSIANITNDGLVTALSTGTVTFTCTSLVTGCETTTTLLTIGSGENPTIMQPEPFCVGNSIQLYPTSGGIWSSSNAIMINQTGLALPITYGLVTFTFTDSTTGCNSSTIPVEVYQLPLISSPSIYTCVNSTLQLSSDVLGIWSSNDSNIASINNDGLVTGLSNGNASFSFTNIETGCVGFINIDIRTLPIADSIQDLVFCAGETIPGMYLNSNINVSNYWTNNNVNIGLAASGEAYIDSFTALNTTLDEIVSNIAVTPVYSACNVTTEYFTITVKPSPIINAGNDTTICIGQSYMPYSNGNTSVLQWSNGVVDSVAIFPSSTNSLILTGEFPNGCITNDSILITVSHPNITFSSLDGINALCDVILSANVTNAIPPYVYSWNTGEITTSIENLCSGIYSLTVTDMIGCTTNSSATIHDNILLSLTGDTIIYSDILFLDSTIIGSDSSAWIENCSFDYSLVNSVTIDSYVDSGDSTFVTWIISLSNGTTVQVVASYLLSPGSAGVYELTLQLTCSQKSGPKFIIARSRFYYEGSSVGLQTHSLNPICLYPNPTKSTLSISGINTNFSYQISDLQGKILKLGANNKQIDIEHLPAGTYVIGISTDSEVKQLRFVKM